MAKRRKRSDASYTHFGIPLAWITLPMAVAPFIVMAVGGWVPGILLAIADACARAGNWMIAEVAWGAWLAVGVGCCWPIGLLICFTHGVRLLGHQMKIDRAEAASSDKPGVIDQVLGILRQLLS